MAYSILKKENNTTPLYYREFVCDTVEDIAKLPTTSKNGSDQDKDTISDEPCAPGSTAFVIATSSVYMLGSDDVWHEI